MEYMAGGNLARIFGENSKNTFKERQPPASGQRVSDANDSDNRSNYEYNTVQALWWMLQAARGLEFIHANKVLL